MQLIWLWLLFVSSAFAGTEPRKFIEQSGLDFEYFAVCHGEYRQVFCGIHGEPMPDVEWVKLPNQTIKPSEDENSRYRIAGTSLLIRRANYTEDTGYYRCIAKNEKGKLQSLRLLEVFLCTDGNWHESGFRWYGHQAKFIASPKSQTVKIGETLTLYCNASGEPEPALRWLKDGEPLLDYGARMTSNKLEIDKFRPEDAGNYTCMATNGHMPSYASAVITVKEEEEI